MDRFKIAGSLTVRAVCEILFTLVVIGGAIALLCTGVYEMTDVGPLIFLGLFIWLIYDCWKLIKIVKFFTEVSDDGINVNGVYKGWQDITSAEIKNAFGTMKPAIILNTSDQMRLKIPSAIKSKEYITAKVEKHVKNIKK